MKLISAILSLYILALTIVPCCSFDNCPDDKTEQASNHERGDEDGCGSCSPFFSCEGCLCPSNVTEPITFSLQVIVPAKTKYAGLIFSFHSYDFHSIWQPPQLV